MKRASALVAVSLFVAVACKTAPETRSEVPAPTLPTETLTVVNQTLTDCSLKYTATIATEAALTLTGAVFEVVADGQVVSQQRVSLSVFVAPGDPKEFSFEAPLTYVKDPELLKTMDVKGGSMLLAVRGDLVGTITAGDGPHELKVPFARSREVRTPRLPKVKVVDFEAGRFSESEVQVLFHVGVVNPNPFEVMITGLSYEAVLAGKKVGDGFVGKGERVAPASTGVFDVALTLNEETFGPDVKALIKSLSVPYVLTGTMTTSVSSAPLEARGDIKLRQSN